MISPEIEGGDQPPHQLTDNLLLAGNCGLVDQPGAGGGAAHPVLLMEAVVAEFEHKLFHRLRPRLEHRRPVGRQAEANGHQDVVEGGRGAAGGAAHRDVGGFLAEVLSQHTKPGAVEGKGDHGEGIPAPLGLNLQGMAELLPHPAQLRRSGAHQHRQTRRGLDRRLDLPPQRITPPELPRIDPHLLVQIRQRLPQLSHKAVIG